MTRPRVKLRHSLVMMMILAGVPVGMRAQDASTISLRAADSVHSPITPKRAFLSSLLVPGAGQNVLGRHRVGAGLIAVEAIAVAMIRESGAELREARQQAGDTLVMSYVDSDGNPVSAPDLQRRRFGDQEIRSRRSHVEDWIALLVANHLFAACDAYVAASLWDVPAHVTVRADRGGMQLLARIPW
ncbi:MAG TPA: hypothetical protein VIV65_02185 [Gemmatimonadaceae bacterium]|jgi:hypothetical protein